MYLHEKPPETTNDKCVCATLLETQAVYNVLEVVERQLQFNIDVELPISIVKRNLTFLFKAT